MPPNGLLVSASPDPSDLWPPPSLHSVFFELGGLDLADAGRAVALAGTAGVAPAARQLVRADASLNRLLAAVLRRQVADAPHAMDGRLLLSSGSWGNGRPFHSHGPSLFALMRGVKHWFVRRPNASFEWQTVEVARGGSLHASHELPAGWESHLWQCSQRRGELLWVPDQLPHATLNHASQTTGLAMVMDDAQTLTALHMAAQSGEAATVRSLLRRGYAVDAVAAANGATPLFYAAALGACEAVEVLLEHGAAVNARANQGLTALHVAAAGGHSRAARLLAEQGAALDAADENGHTPLELARQLGHVEVVRALERSSS